MKNNIIISSILLFITTSVFSQSTEYNYIKSTVYLDEETTQKVTSVSYKDAFGRPMQDIVIGASPAGNDIVQTYEYDNLGRVEKSYLPFTNSGQNGEFVDDALDLQTSFYNTAFPGKNAYSEAEYDNSPYNRIIKQSIPGEDINNVNISTEFTSTGGIDLWEVNNNDQLIKNGTYAGNSLMKFTGKDADGKEIYIYKDKTGKVLLKEALNGSAKTRYVYDKYEQLRYVLSPEAVNQMAGPTYDINSDLIKKYCYYYEYNNKHQLVTKQLPGKEPVYLRYDSRYRLRMTQDGNQRLAGKWMFINYDLLGRTISTGLGDLGNGTVPDTIIPPAEKGITAFHTYQYYDNYDFIEDADLQFNASLAYHDKFDRIKGKSTGSKVRVMANDSEEWLTSVVYYDKFGRVIQTISQNNLGGYDIVSNKYNFAGELLKSKHKHKIKNRDPYFLVYLYTYDHTGRLKEVMLSQNEDESSPVVINEITYNELGQVKEKKIHSENGTGFLQTVDYGYNIKGAITNINDPSNLGTDDLFGLELFYDEEVGTYGNETYEDGKISAIQWNSKNLNQVQTYMYEYDDLNRLTKATFAPYNKYDVNISYDLNGNITHLGRKGEVIKKTKSSAGPPTTPVFYELIDDLTYTYGGNKLECVADAITEVESQLNNDFQDYEGGGAKEYHYDVNGNMTKDLNKGINLVKYNHLNQPTEVQKSADDKTVYIYTATGLKLKTEVYEAGKLKTTTDYSGAYVYENDKLSFINIPGGRIVPGSTKALPYEPPSYQYRLTDHLGNVRVTFRSDMQGNAVIIQEDHYYPFGMRMNGMHVTNTDLINKYLYNGKELQEQTNFYDFGFRQQDPQLGRWHVVDLLAERFYSESPYSYAGNNPISNIDPNGLTYRPDVSEFPRSGGCSGGVWAWFGDGISSYGEVMDMFAESLGSTNLNYVIRTLDRNTSANGYQVGNWTPGGGYSYYETRWDAMGAGISFPCSFLPTGSVYAEDDIYGEFPNGEIATVGGGDDNDPAIDINFNLTFGIAGANKLKFFGAGSDLSWALINLELIKLNLNNIDGFNTNGYSSLKSFFTWGMASFQGGGEVEWLNENGEFEFKNKVINPQLNFGGLSFSNDPSRFTILDIGQAMGLGFNLNISVSAQKLLDAHVETNRMYMETLGFIPGIQ